MDRTFAEHFAMAWIEAWNSHDINEIMAHYADDFEMTSPFIYERTGGKTATLFGSKVVKDYWISALEKFADLNFELLDVLASANSIVIYYKSVMGKTAAELMVFDEAGHVIKSIAHYRDA